MTHQGGSGLRPVANPPTSWCAILPVRGFSGAKSRLGAELPDPPNLRAELARAFALDVLAAVASCPSVDCILIVGDGGPELLSLLIDAAGEPAAEQVSAISAPAGLNLAVAHGEAWARAHDHLRIAVIAADLPCLTADDVRTVLAGAALIPRVPVRLGARSGLHADDLVRPCLVLDQHRLADQLGQFAGDQTTHLVENAARRCRHPTFGEHSARRHLATGAEPLPATAAARLDVDQLDALLRARDLGVGAATAAVLSRHGMEPHSAAGSGNDPAQQRAAPRD